MKISEIKEEYLKSCDRADALKILADENDCSVEDIVECLGYMGIYCNMTKGNGRMKPIYQPKGAAKEYGDYALNIYAGCPHKCWYCYAPVVLHRDREKFHSIIEPRKRILTETINQLNRENISGKLIHLCFACDPYPTGYDSTMTREIITTLKNYGNHIQILTKGCGSRDFDLLDDHDWYGISIDGNKNASYMDTNRLTDVFIAKSKGINTWCSFEPVLDADYTLYCIEKYGNIFDKIAIGKLNYKKSDINWGKFGKEAEKLCKEMGINYYIKESLRKEM